MSIEEQLKNLILKKYKSLRQFAPYTGLPYSTIAAILKRGIMNSNIENVFKICEVLKISVDDLVNGKIVEKVDFYIEPDVFAETKNDNQKIPSVFLKEYIKRIAKDEILVVDNKPLNSDEADFLNDSISLVFDQIRNKRNRLNK